MTDDRAFVERWNAGESIRDRRLQQVLRQLSNGHKNPATVELGDSLMYNSAKYYVVNDI